MIKTISAYLAVHITDETGKEHVVVTPNCTAAYEERAELMDELMDRIVDIKEQIVLSDILKLDKISLDNQDSVV